MSEFELNAEVRSETGKGAMRRLRRTGRVPAVLYGGGQPPASITLNANELKRQLQHEAFFSHILTVKTNGGSEQVILKDMQREPGTWKVLHLDLQRVVATEAFDMDVPLHFVGEEESPGERSGGMFSHHINEVTIRCLPKDLPAYIEVDASGVDVGDSLYLSDLKLPPGVTLVAFAHGQDEQADDAILTCYRPQELEVPEEEEAVAAAEEEQAAEVPTTRESEDEESES